MLARIRVHSRTASMIQFSILRELRVLLSLKLALKSLILLMKLLLSEEALLPVDDKLEFRLVTLLF